MIVLYLIINIDNIFKNYNKSKLNKLFLKIKNINK